MENSYPQPPAHPSGVPQAERQWAMFAHLSTLSMFLGIPFGNILGPLIIFLIKKDEMPFGGSQAKEALNFQISMTIYTIVSGILVLIFVGVLLLFALLVIFIVFTIIAAVKSNEGQFYRYPLTIRFVS